MVQATSSDSHVKASSVVSPLLIDNNARMDSSAAPLTPDALSASSTGAPQQGDPRSSSGTQLENKDLISEQQASSPQAPEHCRQQAPGGQETVRPALEDQARLGSSSQIGTQHKPSMLQSNNRGSDNAESAATDRYKAAGSRRSGRLVPLQAQMQNALALAQRLSDKAKRLSAACTKPNSNVAATNSWRMPSSQQQQSSTQITSSGHSNGHAELLPHIASSVMSQGSIHVAPAAPPVLALSADAAVAVQGDNVGPGTGSSAPTSNPTQLPTSNPGQGSLDNNGTFTAGPGDGKEQVPDGARRFQRSWSQWTSHDTAHQAALAAQHEELLSRREHLYKMKVARLEAQLADQEARCAEQTSRADTLQAQLSHTEELLAMARLGGWWEEAAAD